MSFKNSFLPVLKRAVFRYTTLEVISVETSKNIKRIFSLLRSSTTTYGTSDKTESILQ